MVNPEILPRLSQLSRSFQRIKYHRLRFEVVAGFPSTSSGGYVAGFVKDATDPMRESSAATTLLASGGTCVKAWQSTEVVVQSLPDLYYTSTAPNSERWSSPGSFVIAWTSPNTVEGNFSVYVHWDVTLSAATYEDEGEGEETGFATCLADAYTSTGNPYLSVRNGSSWTPMKATHFSPVLKSGDRVTLLSFKFGSYQNSSGTLDGLYGFRRLLCVGNGSSSYIKPIDEKGDSMTVNFHDEAYVLFKGEKGELARASLNSLRVSWFLSPTRVSPDFPTTSGKCLQEPLLQSPVSESPSSISCFPDSTEKLSQENMPLLEPSYTSCSMRYETSSEIPPPSPVVTLLRSLEKRMEHLLSLQERSTEPSEEFELLERVPEGDGA